MSETVETQTLALIRETAAALEGSPLEGDLTAIEERLTGPLRLAIAGRVKAGKSTLLNALVGARLAPTDASECTRIVSWYRNGPLYKVEAVLHDGARRPLKFTRHEASLDVELGEIDESDVSHLDIQWPTSNLERITLVDTPGLESLNDENSRRTRDFLEVDEFRGSDVDAVIYLMRHLHATDVAFLGAYMDRSVPESSPVNAVAVLSRADEVGAGRLDAMESAQRIAERYRTNEQVRKLASTVIPMAGLLAETGLTLREEEATALTSIARLPVDECDSMLLSAKHFVEVSRSDLTAQTRSELVHRLGMFGIRYAIQEIRAGASTASELAPRLTATSGLHRLNTIIEEQLLPRSRVLQSRTALAALRGIARRLDDSQLEVRERVIHEAERIEVTAVEFAQMRAGHLVASGAATLPPPDVADLERLFLEAPSATAVGLPVDATDDAVAEAAARQIDRWRSRANDVLAGISNTEVFEAAARTCETMYAAATASSSRPAPR